MEKCFSTLGIKIGSICIQDEHPQSTTVSACHVRNQNIWIPSHMKHDSKEVQSSGNIMGAWKVR